MLLKDALSGRRIVLGSASPRRRELLAGLGLEFTVEATPGAPETYSPDLSPDEVPSALAASKSEGFHRLLEDDEILITADTVVICGPDILGKPSGRDEAAQMLRELSGRAHRVVTGVCIRDTRHRSIFSCTSEVEFKTLTDEEINYYIERFRPFDKAGSYGIQEWIGYIGITSIRGSYFNIVGLPVQRLYTALSEFIGL
ncbi:MAG TPA: septum formation protein Maf [Candidatus Coprenecus pullistercoris]|nr:septum formation protein Maf [Candidatus Coprenecus pullistercoris]